MNELMPDYITREEFQNFRDDILAAFKDLKEDRKGDFDELKVWMEEYLQQQIQPFSEDLHNRQDAKDDKKENKRVFKSALIDRLTSSGLGTGIGIVVGYFGLSHK